MNNTTKLAAVGLVTCAASCATPLQWNLTSARLGL